jgi:hypothetical protein
MPSAEASGVPARSGAEQSVALADLDRLDADLADVRAQLMDPSVDSETKDRFWKLVRRAHISLGQRMRYPDDHNHWLGMNIGRLLDINFLDSSAVAAFGASITSSPPPEVLRSAADIIHFTASAVLRGQRYEGDQDIQTTWARIRKLHNELKGKQSQYARVLAETYQAMWNVESNPAGVSGVSHALIVGLMAVRAEYAALNPAWVEDQLKRAKLGKQGKGHGPGKLSAARIAAKLSIKCNAFGFGHDKEVRIGRLFSKQWESPLLDQQKAMLARWG